MRRRRSQLCDALLDGHFHFSGKRIALAAEPDLLFTLSRFFADLGAETVLAVTTAGDNPILKDVPAEIRWVEDNRVGMEFIDPIETRIYDALLTLIPPRRTAW